jgi:ribosome-binding protein aMBF1 (putative translation factor)
MDNEAKCWLCGRDIEGREIREPFPHSGIPVHRECLERGHRAEAPLGEPGDVVYF